MFLDPRKSEKNKNQILIAISNELDISNGGAIKWLSNDINSSNPNYLQVDIQYKNEPLTIIGTRIRIDDCSNNDFMNRKHQFDSILSHVNNIKDLKKSSFWETLIMA